MRIPLLLALLLPPGCGNQEAPADQPADPPAARKFDDMFVLTRDDAGRTARVPVGRGFGIRIGGIGTRQYEWELKETPPHLRYEAFNSAPEGPPGPPRAGGSVTLTWHFTAVRPGRGVVRYEKEPGEYMDFEVVAE